VDRRRRKGFVGGDRRFGVGSGGDGAHAASSALCMRLSLLGLCCATMDETGLA
jgi:hypothetical protein